MPPVFRATLLSLVALAGVAATSAQAATVPELLFKNVPGANVLSDGDKRNIAALLPLAVGPKGLIDNSATCREDSYVAVAVRDLNGDGHPEVIVSEGNGCLYGMRGGVTHFLAGDTQGNWRDLLVGDGNTFEIKPSKPGTWPTILPGVMGFCYPEFDYSETQKKYVLVRRVSDPQSPNACKNMFGK